MPQFQNGDIAIHRCYQARGSGYSGLILNVVCAERLATIRDDAGKLMAIAGKEPSLRGLALNYARAAAAKATVYAVSWNRQNAQRYGLDWLSLPYMPENLLVGLAPWQQASCAMRQADQLAARLWNRWADAARIESADIDRLWKLQVRAEHRYQRRASRNQPKGAAA